jgi:Asp-tRNA(Asn)/Glu-tRNA(Gln) amidotransferase B subunit
VLEKAGYEVKKVLDIKPHPELGDKLTSNFDDILNDKEISVVAEAIGGLEPAHTFVVKALKAKKNVVSSNKHLICTYYDELLTLAKTAIESNQKSVNDYKNGKTAALRALIGKAMAESRGLANPKLLEAILLEELAKE